MKIGKHNEKKVCSVLYARTDEAAALKLLKFYKILCAEESDFKSINMGFISNLGDQNQAVLVR